MNKELKPSNQKPGPAMLQHIQIVHSKAPDYQKESHLHQETEKIQQKNIAQTFNSLQKEAEINFPESLENTHFLEQNLIKCEQMFKNKNKYNNLNQINQAFLQTIENGAIRISQFKQMVSNKAKKVVEGQSFQRLFFEEQQRIKQISEKKLQMIDELKKLYDQERSARATQKRLFLLNKASADSVIFNQVQNHRSIQKKCKSLPKNPLSTKTLNLENDPFQSKTREKEKGKSYSKSYFTKEQKKKILEIIRKNNLKQMLIEKRAKQLAEKIEREKIQTINSQKEIIQKLRKSRKECILEKFKTIERLKTDFMKEPSSLNSFQTQPSESFQSYKKFSSNGLNQEKIKNFKNFRTFSRKYIYQKFQEFDIEKSYERRKYHEIVLSQKRQQTKVNLEEIRVHLQNYNQAKTKKIQMKKQKIQRFKQEQKERLKQIRSKFGFMTKIKQHLLSEEKASIQKYEDNLNRKLNYQRKMKDYFLSVKHSTFQSSKKLSHREDRKKTKTSHSYQNLAEDSPCVIQLMQNEKPLVFKALNNKSRNQTHFVERKKRSFKSIAQLNQSNIDKDQTQLNCPQQSKKKGKENDEKMQKVMLKILKNQDASFEEIKQALEILNFLLQKTKKKAKTKSNLSKLIQKSEMLIN